MTEKSFSIPTDIFNPELFPSLLKSSDSPIPLLKEAISRTSDFFYQEYEQDRYIRDLISARAQFIDQLLSACWQHFNWKTLDNICLIAVGGYGRAELHPHSDIDLMVLVEDETALLQHQDNITQLVTLLWDINLEIGHSVRTVEQCKNEAAKDISIVTNLMESRCLIGPESLHQTMMTDTGPENMWSSQEFFRAKWDEQLERHRKHGNSEYVLEANIKSSPGGLRDIQTIGWIAKRHFGIKHIGELVDLGFLDEKEMDIYNRGLDYMWRLRYELHMLTGREEDRLLFDHQRNLAKKFGYEDDEAKMAVEQFMQYYYRWALSLGQLNDVIIQHFDETILRACDAEEIYEINPRFRVRNGHIEVTNDKVFEKTPSALMEIFVLMAQNPHIDGARASTIRLIRTSRDLIDDKFRQDPRNNRYFIEMLRSPEKVALQLRRMLRFGVLGKYLPEFGKIIGQMQHDLFHIFCVDAHTMELIKNISRFTYREAYKDFPIASKIIKEIPKKELLYIAGIYHDIAKGRGGDHSTLGVVDTQAFCEQHEIAKRDTNLICWLVQNHLLMSAVAQRQDISDPEVINAFAASVGDTNYLNYLYLLTVADINATNPTLWNSWRASLLRQLYVETKRALRRGLEQAVDKTDWVIESQQAAILKLEELGFSEDEIRQVWSDISEDYFLREKVDDIVWHTRAISQHDYDKGPLVVLKESGAIDMIGATQIFVHTKDKRAVFALIASGLEQLDLNVVDARIFRPSSEFILDTFYVLDNNGETIGNDPERLAHIQSFLTDQIKNHDKNLDVIKKRTPRQMRLFSVPTRTKLFTDIAGDHSVLEVITPDRPGLLARISRIFMDFDLLLVNAKITTLGERVEDVFFITDQNHNPIEDPAVCAAIQTAICKELDEQAAA